MRPVDGIYYRCQSTEKQAKCLLFISVLFFDRKQEVSRQRSSVLWLLLYILTDKQNLILKNIQEKITRRSDVSRLILIDGVSVALSAYVIMTDDDNDCDTKDTTLTAN